MLGWSAMGEILRFRRIRRPRPAGHGWRLSPWLAPGLALSFVAAVAFFYRPAPPENAGSTVAFTMCTDQVQRNCVIDGDTFRLDDERVRIEDIDAPEIFSPKCTQERAIGIQAKQELLALLNDGRFTLARYQGDEQDAYGRKLWTVEHGGRSVGSALVEKGLARRWNEPERDWCE